MDAKTIAAIAHWVACHAGVIAVIVSLILEWIPTLNINPISFILNLIFSPINKRIDKLRTELKGDIDDVKSDLKEEIDSIKDRQEQQEESTKDLIKSIEFSEISRIRWDIIEFSNSLDNDQLHTRDEYRHILDDGKKYHQLIDKYGLENGIITEELDKIQTHYDNKRNNTTSVYF